MKKEPPRSSTGIDYKTSPSNRFSQLTTLQIRVFNTQPQISDDMLDFIAQVIAKTEARLPALEQSIQEIKIEWKI